MDNIKIAASERTPEVDFDFQNNVFILRGESYPEDVSAFFGPVVGQFEEHLSALEGATLRFDFEFIYFNSSTAKIVMGLLDKLEESAQNGNKVTVRWLYEEDDENMQELGEEFGEDLEHAEFRLEALSD
ncbi:MAG TPA: DUF1987 domain-containing protein [Gammaproteobacteria bacterium]